MARSQSKQVYSLYYDKHCWLEVIYLQMLLTASTRWRTIGSPPTRSNSRTTAIAPQEQGLWSAGKRLESPVCELQFLLGPASFFVRARSLLLPFCSLLLRLRTDAQLSSTIRKSDYKAAAVSFSHTELRDGCFCYIHIIVHSYFQHI